MKRRMLPILLSLALCLSLLPTAALAAEEGVTYIERSWDGSKVSSVEETKPAGEYTVISESSAPTTWGSVGSTSWYVAQDDVTISSYVTVTGNVHLILADNCTLTVNEGIEVTRNNKLIIYGQSDGEKAGKLVANGSGLDPGIGDSIGQSGGVTIHGGMVEATGGTGGAGIGIGGYTDPMVSSVYHYGGTLTIYGGTVTASSSGGAGIGGGHLGDGGTVNIYGGTVTAKGGDSSAGIGGGRRGTHPSSNISGGGNGGTVAIYGGTVTAIGGDRGAGIGKGDGGSNNGSFSTGENGSAVIFAQGGQGAVAISDTSGQKGWQGVIFQGAAGQVYGSNITPTEDFTIEADKTLTIKKGQTLTIPEGVTLTISEGATVTNEGTITNNGTIDVYGTLTGNQVTGGTVNYKVTDVSLDKESLTLEVGGSEPLKATVEPDNATNKKVTWSTSAPNVATVENGVVTAVGAGTATITATAADGSGKSDTCTVTVTQTPVTGVTLDQTSLTLTEGETGNLIATVQPENATNKNVTWESSDTSVATVDENGVVTAVGAGTATITVKTQDGDFTATCTVTVERPYTPPPANPNYRIDVTTTEGGTVTKDPAAAKAGETVTLTPAPEEGYEVGEVIVTDRFGDTVEVTANPDSTYTFTMPSGQVRVEVTFVEATPEPLPFADVAEGDWFHDAVQYAYENGLMDGVGDGQFAPNATTNRAMVVTILYRLAGEPDVSGDAAFTDVAPGLWYTNAVAWAAQKGIVNGISATEFSPSGDLTREQLATVLYRYAEGMGYDVSAQADLSGFPDAGDIQSYATEALSWAVAEGLLQGFEDDSLQPQSTATRAQIATILMRFCEGVAE